METKQCTKCKRILPLSAFGLRNSKTGAYRADCKECHAAEVREKYHQRKEMLNDFKSQCKCAKCGDTRSYVLDFHHINPNEKEDTLARLTSNTSSVERINTEMQKCVVLCSNCHREFHYLNEKDGITLEEYLGI